MLDYFKRNCLISDGSMVYHVYAACDVKFLACSVGWLVLAHACCLDSRKWWFYHVMLLQLQDYCSGWLASSSSPASLNRSAAVLHFCSCPTRWRQASVCIALAARQSADCSRTQAAATVLLQNPGGGGGEHTGRGAPAPRRPSRPPATRIPATRAGRDQARENLAAALAGFRSPFLSRWWPPDGFRS